MKNELPDEKVKELHDWVDGLIIEDAPNVSKSLRDLIDGTRHIKIPHPHLIIQDAADTIDCLLINIKRGKNADLAETRADDGWRPTHRHKVRGTNYQVIGMGTMQAVKRLVADDEQVVIYKGDDGKLWVRSWHEFTDGRFERLPQTFPAPPQTPEEKK